MRPTEDAFHETRSTQKVTHETTKMELVATYDPKSLVVTVTYPTKLELHIHLSKASS
jgi:hypothetical protein